jgi:YVTN family beta-propeller protein
MRTSSHLRSRWAAIGAAVAVSIGAGGIMTTSASIGSGERAVFVPITPCRLLDTRSGTSNVGPRATPLTAGDTYTATVWGTNGNCTIPSDAVGVSLNVVAINPTSGSYLTVFPSDATRPLSSNLNWVANQAPTPNAVTADLSADGKVSFYNLAGNVDIAADIVGYYADHNHDDRYDTKTEVNTKIANMPGWTSRLTAAQLAMRQWGSDPARQRLVAVSGGPSDVAFDGTYMWVSRFSIDSVSKIDPATNAIVGTYPAGDQPGDVLFDGTYIWVVNAASNNVTKLVAATGAAAPGSPITVGTTPVNAAFDGTNVWVTNYNTNNLAKINATTNAITFISTGGGSNPIGTEFDGTSIWVAYSGLGQVVKVNPSTNVIGAPTTVAATPLQFVFDGSAMWVSSGSGTVTKLALDNTVLTTVTVADNPAYMVFDGRQIWVARTGNTLVARIDTTANVVTTTVSVGSQPSGMAFDGVNVWLAQNVAGVVVRLIP